MAYKNKIQYKCKTKRIVKLTMHRKDCIIIIGNLKLVKR